MAETKELVFKLLADTSEGRAAIEKMSKSLKGMGDSAENQNKRGAASANAFHGALNSVKSIAGALGFTFGTLAIANMVREWTREAIQFEREFANVTTLFDTSREDVAAMRKELLGLGGELGSAVELTRGLYQAISAGQKPGESVKFVAEAAKFATAALTDTFTAVDVLTTILNAYGMKAEEVTSVSDDLFEVIKQGKTTGQELASSLGTIIPTAATLGVGLKELGAALATLTKGGIKTDEAVTSLNRVLMAFLDPAPQARKLAEDLGVELSASSLKADGLFESLKKLAVASKGNAEATAEFFGNVRALKGVLALTGQQADEFERILAAMQDTTGNVTEAFDKQTETIGHQFESLWNNLTIQWITATEGLGALGSTLRIVNGLLEAMPEFLSTIASLLTGPIGAFAKFVGSLKDVAEGFERFAAIAGFTKFLADAMGDLSAKTTHLSNVKDRLNATSKDFLANLGEEAKKAALTGGAILDFSQYSELAATATAKLAEEMKKLAKETKESWKRGDSFRFSDLIKSEDVEEVTESMRRLREEAQKLPLADMAKELEDNPLFPPTAVAGIDDYGKALKGLPGLYSAGTDGAKKFSEVLGNQVSTIFSDFAKGMADTIIEWKGFWSTLVNTAKQFATAILRLFFEGLFAPVAAGLKTLFGGGGFGEGFNAAGGFGSMGQMFKSVGSAALGLVKPLAKATAGLFGLGAAAGDAALSAGTLGAGVMDVAYAAEMSSAAATTAATGGFSLFGMSLTTAIPVIGGVAAGLYGLYALLRSSPAEKFAKDLSRDFGGVSMSAKSVEQFGASLGLTMKQIDGIRKDLQSSPVFLRMSYDAAEAQGKTDSFLASLEHVQTAWGTFNFRTAFEEGLATDNWAALNKAFTDAFGVSERLVSAFRGDLSPLLLKVSEDAQAAANSHDELGKALDALRAAPEDAAKAVGILAENIEWLREKGATTEEILQLLGPTILEAAKASQMFGFELPTVVEELLNTGQAADDALEPIKQLSAEWMDGAQAAEHLMRRGDDLAQYIQGFAQTLLDKGIPAAQAQQMTWDQLGDQIVSLADQYEALGLEVPSLIRQAMDWATANGYLGDSTSEVTQEVAKEAEVVKEVAEALSAYEEGVKSMTDKLDGSVDSLERMRGRVTAFAQHLLNNGIPVLEAQNRTWDEFGSEIMGAYNNLVMMGDEVPPFLQQMINWALTQNLVTQGIDGTGDVMKAQTVELSNGQRAWDNYSSKLLDVNEVYDFARAGIAALGLDMKNAADVALIQQLAWDQYGNAILSTAEQYRQMGLEIPDAIKAMLEFATNAAGVTDAEKAKAAALLGTTSAIRDQADALRELEKAYVASSTTPVQKEAAVSQQKAVRDVVGRTGAGNVSTVGVRYYLGINSDPQGYMRDVLDPLVARAGTEAVGDAMYLVYQGIAGSVIDGLNLMRDLGYIPSFKEGGTMEREGFAYLHAGETVTPANQKSTQATVVVNLYGDVYGLDDLDRKIAESITRTSRGGGLRGVV